VEKTNGGLQRNELCDKEPLAGALPGKSFIEETEFVRRQLDSRGLFGCQVFWSEEVRDGQLARVEGDVADGAVV
jgi:hypothetical protein